MSDQGTCMDYFFKNLLAYINGIAVNTASFMKNFYFW